MSNSGHLIGFMPGAVAPVLPTPILEYTFASEDFTDTSGNGYTGTGYGTPTFVEGKGGPGTFAVNLNGTSQWFSFPSNAAWEELSGKEFSFAMWVKIPTKNWTANTTGLIHNWEQTQTVPTQYWALSFDSNVVTTGFQCKNAVAETIDTTGTTGLVSSTYKLLIMTQKNGVYNYYIDDVFEATDTFTTDASVDSGRLVGVGGYYGRYIAMLCDRVMFYNTELTSDERTDLFENT